MNFPKVHNNQLKGMTGEAYFQYFVNNELKCIYQKVDAGNDFGVDGFIELVVDGYATGKKIAVQIKYGNSYFKNQGIGGYKFIGEKKHLNYYLNYQLPVLIILIDELFENTAWVEFDINKTMQQNDDKWWIEVPKKNRLDSNFLSMIIKVLEPIIDYENEIEASWMVDRILDNTDNRIISIPTSDINLLNYETINNFIDKLSKNKEKLIKARNTLDLFFPEYEDDKREIYQIPEIMKWFKNSICAEVPWFYFLNYKNTNVGLKILMHSQCVGKYVSQQDDKHLVLYDKNSVCNFYLVNFDIMNKFIERNNISEEINKEISDGIIDFYSSSIY